MSSEVQDLASTSSTADNPKQSLKSWIFTSYFDFLNLLFSLKFQLLFRKYSSVKNKKEIVLNDIIVAIVITLSWLFKLLYLLLNFYK